MKTLIVYSSLTGNTKKVAEAIAAVLPGCDLLPVETRTWLGGVKNARLAFFGTLGAWPDSDHAKECMKKGEELALVPERGNKVYGSWLCQGKIDPRVLEAMARMAGNVHPMTPERKARIEEAAKHPDEDDCRRAQAFFRGILEKMN